MGTTLSGIDSERYCSAMPDHHSTFADLGLKPVVVHALRRVGVESPFPIQTAVVQDALAGSDILGRAPTGSGKTLAFGLPLLQRLSGGSSRPSRPRSVILAPTRELALQIEQALDEPALALGVRVAAVVGGVPVRRQVDRLARGVDVVVATPGRLEDLAARGSVDLSSVTISVVDEADRMADLGFLPQVVSVLDRTDADGQRMLFSATLDHDVDELIRRYLRSPVTHTVDVAPIAERTAEHYFFRVAGPEKDSVVASIAARDGRTILFLRTKFAVDRLTDSLRSVGVNAASLHGDKSQANRTRTLASFEDGRVPVLVATDVMARGIHVGSVSVVVHVDPPADAKEYTHRAGRTARAGASGVVVTLATDSQVPAAMEVATAAGIDAHFVAVTEDDPVLVSVIGARRPPGRPVAEHFPASATGTSAAATSGSRPGRAPGSSRSPRRGAAGRRSGRR